MKQRASVVSIVLLMCILSTSMPAGSPTGALPLHSCDALGRPVTTTVTAAPGTTRSDLNRTSLTAYDPVTGQTRGTQDALGRWTAQQYDTLGRVVTTIQNCTDGQGTPVNPAVGSCAAFSPTVPDQNVPATTRYDALGRAYESVDALGHVTHTAYDGLSRPLSTTVSYGGSGSDAPITMGTGYDALGEATSRTDALGQTTTTGYDGLGQAITVTDALSRTTLTGYDGTGTLRWTRRPDGRLTLYGVDGLGRTITTTVNYSPTAPAGSSDANLVTGTRYDAGGRTVQTSDPAGHVTTFSYDLRDHLVQQSQNVQASCPPTATDCNITTTYQYDRAGNRVATSDPRGNTTTYQYDAADEQTGATDALGRSTTTSYDAGGRVVGRQDSRGSAGTVAYQYDGLDRPVTTTAPNLAGGMIVAGYNALGQRTSLTDGSGTTQVAYDAFGRTLAITAPRTGALSYSYDQNGRRTGLSYPDGTRLGYSYQADGQLSSVTQAGVGQPLASYRYEPLTGRLASVTRLNGSTTSYGYDGADRLLAVRTTVNGLRQSSVVAQVNVLGQETVVTETERLTPLGGGTGNSGSGGIIGYPGGGQTGQTAGASLGRSSLLSSPLGGATLGAQSALAPAPLAVGPVRPALRTGTAASALSPASLVHAPLGMSQTAPATTAAHGARPAPPHLSTLRLLLAFAPNRGQSSPQVRYLAQGTGYTLALTGSDAVLALSAPAGRSHAGLPLLRRVVVRLHPVGANAHARVEGLNRLPGHATYLSSLHGHPRARTVPTYARVRYHNLYPGIDLVYYGTTGRLEYDYVLAPQADARAIRLVISGTGRLRLAPDGALLLPLPGGTLRQAPPHAYQVIQGHRHPVAARYVLLAGHTVGLRLGRYDHRRTLVIDPVLGYGSYLGGTGNDDASAVALDSQGNTYIAGYTNSPDFITTTGAYSTTLNGGSGTNYDAFVTAINSSGAISYSTYLGGSGTDAASGIAVDGQGNAYVTGRTSSADFPHTQCAHAGTVLLPLPSTVSCAVTAVDATTPLTSSDAFVVKLSPDGSHLVYGTVLSGSGDDWGRSIAVDASGVAYLTGQTDSPLFPTTAGAVQLAGGTCSPATGLLSGSAGPSSGPCYDAFVTTLGATGVLSYSTYLGGGRDDYGYGIALDPTRPGAVLVTGRTESPDFPTTSGTLSTSFNHGSTAPCGQTNCPDAFVAKVDTTVSLPPAPPVVASALLWSTLLGGSGADEGRGIATDSSGNIYVTGVTTSPNFPTTNAYSATLAGGSDAFVSKLSGDGSSLSWSSYLGGSGDDSGNAIAVDTSGHAYVTGQTYSPDFPTIGSLQPFSGTGPVTTSLAFVARFTRAGSGLVYSSYLGGSGGDAGHGIAVDAIGDVVLVGQTGSSDLLTLRPQQPSLQSTPDAFVAGVDNTTRHLVYSYDGVQRLVSVTETLGDAYQYRYDPAGNRTAQSVNGVPTQLLSYDAANEIVTATTPQGTTAYQYDGAGNLQSDGHASYSYDALNRLTTYTAPQATEAYTYNGDGVLVGQGANGTATWLTEDLAPQSQGGGNSGASSSLAQGGSGVSGSPVQGGVTDLSQVQVLATTAGGSTTDYLYGQERLLGAPSSGATSGSTTTYSWYVSDLQGSVRYSQDSSGGSGSSLNYDPTPLRYDPYGVPGTRDGGQQPQTFGYRGELQDPATGLVYLRARMYNPATGQFLQRDPLLQQTGQAYLYAGNDPLTRSDPSGQYLITARCSPNPLRQAVENTYIDDSLLAGHNATCNLPVPGRSPLDSHVVADDADGGRVWVVEPLEQLLPRGYLLAHAAAVQAVAALRARDAGACRLTLFDRTNGGRPTRVSLPHLAPGAVLGYFGGAAAIEVGRPTLEHPTGGGAVLGDQLVYGQFRLPADGPGFGRVAGVLYYQRQSRAFARSGRSCLGSFTFQEILHCGYQFILGNDLDALGSSRVGFFGKLVAVVDLASNALVLVPLVRGGVKGLAKAVLSQTLHTAVDASEVHTLEEVGGHAFTEADYEQLHQPAQDGTAGVETRDPRLDVTGGCTCFVAGTRVATPTGSVAIETLHQGEQVLSEEPLTGKIEAEPVEAVITDSVKPLIAVSLSDGTVLRVTADHPFWVDGGAGLDHAGWLPAGQLRPGDRLRTAGGKDVVVVSVRHNVGRAVVYTLTVAKDHTFFVGSARVLVHNCSITEQQLQELIDDTRYPRDRAIETATGPSGTAVQIAGRGVQGADVRFYRDGELVLLREAKKLEGKSLDNLISKGTAQTANQGVRAEVYILVPSNTTTQQTESLVRQFLRGLRPSARADYKNVYLRIFDPQGNVLYNKTVTDVGGRI